MRSSRLQKKWNARAEQEWEFFGPVGSEDSASRLKESFFHPNGEVIMIIALKEAWAKFEKYAMDKGYTERILTAYVLCNPQGNRIKLISIRASQNKMVIWEDNMDYYEMDI